MRRRARAAVRTAPTDHLMRAASLALAAALAGAVIAAAAAG